MKPVPAPASDVKADDEDGDGNDDLDGEPLEEGDDDDDGGSMALDSDAESAAEQSEILQEAENIRAKREVEAKKPKEAPLLPPPEASEPVRPSNPPSNLAIATVNSSTHKKEYMRLDTGLQHELSSLVPV